MTLKDKTHILHFSMQVKSPREARVPHHQQLKVLSLTEMIATRYFIALFTANSKAIILLSSRQHCERLTGTRGMLTMLSSS